MCYAIFGHTLFSLPKNFAWPQEICLVNAYSYGAYGLNIALRFLGELNPGIAIFKNNQGNRKTMGIVESVYLGITGGLTFVTEHLALALTVIFVKPFDNLESLWVLIPIYLGMMIADVFQEKRGTSMGNAISNSLIPFWGGIDFLRITFRSWDGGWVDIIKIVLASVIILYGVVIVVVGIYGNEIIKKIGRIREVSYVIIMSVPIYYDIIEFDWHYLVGALMFFPIFYFFFEIVMRFLPDTKALLDEVKVIDSEMHHLKDEIEDFATGNDLQLHKGTGNGALGQKPANPGVRKPFPAAAKPSARMPLGAVQRKPIIQPHHGPMPQKKINQNFPVHKLKTDKIIRER